MSFVPGTGDKFEDHLSQINFLITLNLSKWHLTGGIPSVGLDDLRQILLTHLYKKWDKYDKTRPLGNWANVTIKNQLINLRRNLYYRFVSPCSDCVLRDGDHCKIFGEISNSNCNLYHFWEINKKTQYDVNMPVSSEFHSNEINSKPADSLDIEKIISELLPKLKAKLSPNEYYLFVKIHLENVPEKEALTGLKFVNKTTAAIALKTFKNCIMEKVKQIIKEEEIF